MEEESKNIQQAQDVAENTDTVSSEGASAATAKKVSGLDKFFGITKSGSSFKVEIIAGLTTFMAMVYILMVNGGMFSESWVGLSYGAAYIATAIGAIAGTLLMALLAKMPLAQASGMGVNAFIVYILLKNGAGLTYANCMVFTLIDGVIFVILTATGLRKKIFKAIPASVCHAIPVGIGLFIAFIGLQNAGIIQTTATANPILDEMGNIVGYDGTVSPNTISGFVSFNILAESFSYGKIIAPLVALLGVLAIAVMSKKNVKGAILWGILGSAALYYALAGIGYAVSDETCIAIFSGIKETFSFDPFSAFKDWGTQAVGQVFVKGFDFTGFNGGTGALILLIVTTALSLCMIDMFDMIGTLYGACAKGNLLDKDGVPLNMNKMMLSDAIATTVGAVAGTSTVTTFVESSSGVAAGGKTGFTALVTAILFTIAMFLSPIAQLIPTAATATALIWVGVIMMTSLTKIDWTDAVEAIVAFLTFIVMVLGYSISKGIGIGILAFIVVKICTGKIKEISVPTWVIGVLFLATFILTG